MNLNSLPPEIIQLILSLVPREHLASSSLVCRTWRAAAFTLLYRSIHLVSIPMGDRCTQLNFPIFENRPEELVDRINHETSRSGHELQFSEAVRRLTVAWTMSEQQLRDFGSAVLKMRKLEHLSWIVSMIEQAKWDITLALICRNLPKLRSVKLFLDPDELGISEERTGALNNIKELSVGFDRKESGFHWRVPDTTIRFIGGAQNIESLSLCSEEIYPHASSLPYVLGIDDIMSGLSQQNFPHLHRLHIGPFCCDVPLRMFADPDFRLWQFVRTQKQLRELVWYLYEGGSRANRVTASWSISPRDTEVVPSMTRFKGSARIIPSLLTWNLIKRLETLDIIHVESISPGALSDLLETLRRVSPVGLSYLKGLKISIADPASPNNIERAINVIRKLASGAPILEELIISTSQPPTPYNKECLLDLLAEIPSLRRLGLNEEWLRPPKGLSDTQSFSEQAATLCPVLAVLDNVEFSATLS
ncbi:unnamed protein product [Rhizoctonia solani]|uniref:F-box domain-containing protein n=1 Tax=Rhizoctonia solani TaxID=456999 RepID=A0A8H3E3T4_9AGAM|nr:unnamed protein product [Rhizoctonia solani]